MLKARCIRESNSPYNTPVFCVPKPHSNDPNNVRMVQDFRMCNMATLDTKYSIKEIRECIDTVGRNESKVFSQLDLRSAFWQQEIDEDSRKYTAFTIPGRARFEFEVNPMGLKNSPHSFQRLMDHVFRNQDFIQAYIDDLLVHSQNVDQHLTQLKMAFLRLRENNLKINLEKCKFVTPEVTYLGHTLSKDGVRPAMDHIKAVREFPEPQTVKQIREFTGLTNYFRPHIKNFSLLNSHLSKLLRKDSGYTKGQLPPAAQKAFLQLKEQLCNSPVLAFPNPKHDYILSTDASAKAIDHEGGLGAILSQVGDDGVERVISYASRSLKQYEKNYTPYLLEMLAASWGIDHFHVYLIGRKFTLLVDHRPLEKMSTIHGKTLNRLQEMMSSYNFCIKYRPGKENAAADALSRNAIAQLDSNRVAEAMSFLPEQLDSLKTAQKSDPFLQTLRIALSGKNIDSNNQHKDLVQKVKSQSFVQDDTLMFHFIQKGKTSKELFWIPDSLQFKLINAYHSSKYAGHMGVAKTVDSLREAGYFWTHMPAKIARFIEACPVCLQIRSLSKPSAPLQPLPIPDEPNVRIHMDLIGPLKSRTSNTYCLVITDSFTKFTIPCLFQIRKHTLSQKPL